MIEVPYIIEFTLEGKDMDEAFNARSAGEAFAQCKEKYPEAQMKRCLREGGRGQYWGHTYFPLPKGANERGIKKEPRSARRPNRNCKDGIMPFYDQVKKVPQSR